MIFLGHSHLDAVFAAALARNVPVERISLWQTYLALPDETGGARLNPDIAIRLTGPVALFIGGGAQNVLGQVQHPQRFDFVLPWASDLPLDPDAEILPYEAITAALLHTTDGYLNYIDFVAKACEHPVFQVAPPPPAINDTMPDDPVWNSKVGANREVSSPYLRLKLWEAYSRMVSEFCRTIGVPYVAAPKEARDEAGFLKPELLGKPCHGNERYGSMVLDQLLALGLSRAA